MLLSSPKGIQTEAPEVPEGYPYRSPISRRYGSMVRARPDDRIGEVGRESCNRQAITDGQCVRQGEPCRLSSNSPPDAQPCGPDGRVPAPGGWNRFVFQVENLEQLVREMRAAGMKFRNDVLSGPGGKQILADDPSGNPIELFEERPR